MTEILFGNASEPKLPPTAGIAYGPKALFWPNIGIGRKYDFLSAKL